MEQTSIATLQRVAAPAQPGGAIMAYETSASHAAAQAKAQVEARYAMAAYHPRNMDEVRQTVLKECRRPSFANDKSTWYIKPIGDGVEGLGIRFVEMALLAMSNVLCESSMTFENDRIELHRVSVTDLERNTTYWHDVRVEKSVERSKPMDDGTYISKRKNSYGRDVFTIPGTDDELLNKRNALISKATRTLGERLIPGDLKAEAETEIKKTRKDTAAQDPDAERKRIADAFAEIGVPVAELSEFLGHDLATCSPAELVRLRGIFGAVRDGESTWAEVMDNKATQAKAKPAAPAKDAAGKPPKAKEPAGDGKEPAAAGDNVMPKAVAVVEALGKAIADKREADAKGTPNPALAEADKAPAEAAKADAQEPDPNGFTLLDALSSVDHGDDALALDMARSIGGDAVEQVKAKIAARTSGGAAVGPE